MVESVNTEGVVSAAGVASSSMTTSVGQRQLRFGVKAKAVRYDYAVSGTTCLWNGTQGTFGQCYQASQKKE